MLYYVYAFKFAWSPNRNPSKFCTACERSLSLPTEVKLPTSYILWRQSFISRLWTALILLLEPVSLHIDDLSSWWFASNVISDKKRAWSNKGMVWNYSCRSLCLSGRSNLRLKCLPLRNIWPTKNIYSSGNFPRSLKYGCSSKQCTYWTA